MSNICKNPLYDDDKDTANIASDSHLTRNGSKFWRRDTFRRKVHATALSSLPPANCNVDVDDLNPYLAGEVSPSLPANKVNAIRYFKKLRKKTKAKEQERQTPVKSSIPRSSSPLRSSTTSSCVELLASSEPPKADPSTSPPIQALPPETARVENHEPSGPAPPSEPAPLISWSPYDVAQRIQNMLSLNKASSQEATHSDSTSAQPDSLDPALAKALCSTDDMNGTGPASNNTSVWALLDRVVSPRNLKADTVQLQRQSLISDGSSIMLYAPLTPDHGGNVEMARSRVCSMLFEDPVGEFNVDQNAEQSFNVESGHNNPAQTTKDVEMWIPSKDKISVQTLWWGYRIYLPPPVLVTLNNAQLESAKRAAMITAALQWLLTNLPIATLPPQFRPLSLLLTGLVPAVGYVGGFIAYCWSTIKSFDKGHGVILSATWLLPIALIPGTWHKDSDTEDTTSPTTVANNSA